MAGRRGFVSMIQRQGPALPGAAGRSYNAGHILATARRDQRQVPLLAIPFPAIDPVLVRFGPFAIRWYALAYIVGLVVGWQYLRWLVQRPGWKITPEQLDDFLVYATLGIVLGGRIGYVLFYRPDFYFGHPLEIFAVWQGGMSFHGGLLGVVAATFLFARQRGLPVLEIGDAIACAGPIGLFLGRLANFINGELWGRVSDVPWAMVFPGAGPLPRHPSQLYEAVLEGLVLLAVLAFIIRLGALKRPGTVIGVFALGYGAARLFCEFFREPDPQLGYLWGGLTMGMLLSLPLMLAGIAFLWAARRAEPARAT
jgi:phosphatidylglycerol---prolipoprotein diacylglyceryl transferase